jgi:two-component system, NarL family, nitrate/nitrite response regulator NarL
LEVTRVAIVMETRLYRDALARALSRSGFKITASVATGTEASARPASVADVTLVDVSTHKAIEELRVITDSAPERRLLAVAVRQQESEILSCIEAGAVGYVLRDASLQDLTETIRRAARDEPLVPPHIVATLMRRRAGRGDGSASGLDDLTGREYEVVELIELGLSNKEIATTLSISVTTVKNHVHSILEKLRVSRRGEAASLVRGSRSRP